MKIIQVTASYKPAFVYGGPIMSVAKLSEELCKNDVHLEVYTTLANGESELGFPSGEKKIVENVPVWYFKRITKDHSHFSPALLKHLFREIRHKKEPLIIHIHAWWNLVSVFTCLMAQMKKIPVVLSPRGTLSSYSFNNKHNFLKKWAHLILGKRLLQNCFVHVTSEQEKLEVLQIIQPKSIQVIPNFVELGSISTIRKNQDKTILKLLFLSRIEEKKGLEILLDALAGIKINYHLTIAGTGKPDYLSSVQEKIDKNSMNKSVSWIGFQHNHQKFEVLQNHDLLILPSYNENFANVVIESLSVGTAVLVSDQVGLADYVVKNSIGRVFINNPEDLRRHLIETYNDRIWLKNVRLQSPQKIRADFAEEKLTQQYLDFYQKILRTSL